MKLIYFVFILYSVASTGIANNDERQLLCTDNDKVFNCTMEKMLRENFLLGNKNNFSVTLENIGDSITKTFEAITSELNQQMKQQDKAKEAKVDDSIKKMYDQLTKYLETKFNSIRADSNESADIIASNCLEATKATRRSGVYKILLPRYGTEPFNVACDEDIHNGGWTVVQRRVDGSVDFYRNWTEYKQGFGQLRGDFFIGLEKLHAMTVNGDQELFIAMTDFMGMKKYARYDSLVIGSEDERYNLKQLGEYSGDAGDEMRVQVGMNFTTKDDPNENNCATIYKGAWWFHECYDSNLNGRYLSETDEEEGVFWHGSINENLKYAQMMIRPRRKSDV